MITRIAGAATRGFLVALLIATPALMLPNASSDATQITLLVALLAALLTFSEYNSSAPSIVEFRDASPFNRLRFLALLGSIVLITLVFKDRQDPTATTGAVFAIGTIVGNVMDFPFSPVRLAVLMMPADIGSDGIALVRASAGAAFLSATFFTLVFVYVVRVKGWPRKQGAFNVWVNLPLFDPTAGPDVLERLQRDARVNIVFGLLLPFLIPAIVKLGTDMIDPGMMAHTQTLIWTISAWAFLPASVLMRGIAMQRIAHMIKEQRARVYAGAEPALHAV